MAAISTDTTSFEAVDWLRRVAHETLGLRLSLLQVEAFQRYLEALRAASTRHNLTAVIDPLGIAAKHFLDSLTLVPLLGAAASGRLADVGTGAGFPGLPLRIVCPELKVTLIEATHKKAEFCRAVADDLRLRGVEVLAARAEDVGRDPAHRHAYDVATGRAVAALPVLLEYLLPLVRVGGRVLAQKGESAPMEVQQSGRALEVLGGRLIRLHPVELPGVAERRYIVEIEKTAATPETYPRRAGIPAKRPLVARG